MKICLEVQGRGKLHEVVNGFMLELCQRGHGFGHQRQRSRALAITAFWHWFQATTGTSIIPSALRVVEEMSNLVSDLDCQTGRAEGGPDCKLIFCPGA